MITRGAGHISEAARERRRGNIVRIVSLVPSHSETLVAIGAAEALVAVTRYCLAAPSVRELGVPEVGGTKNPRVPDVISLRPDFVVVSDEENRIEDVEEISSAGIEVIEVSPRSVTEAASGVLRLGDLTGCKRKANEIASEIERSAARVSERAAANLRVLQESSIYCPIWYKPWMSFGPDTYCNSVLQACGGTNVYSDLSSERYFEAAPEDAKQRGAKACLLPTEPFRFGDRHKAMLRRLIGPTEIFDGSALTWYGVRTPWGLRTVSDVLSRLEAELSG